MYVLGTAGHVDHGKSALVLALTGIDPDRLPEEKEREMTIDLGFAWVKLPSGREVSIVDVPGHERFIKNMLAGIGGIDLALLVIAADDGVMPQTREHLAILDLLKINRGIAVITKKDLVDEEMVGLASLEAEELIKGTVLEGSPVVLTSASTGEGLSDLCSTIDRLLESTPPRRDIGRPRLSIDRVFTMRGFGTVVTGTLVDGELSVGQEVEILPTGQRSTLRGLETHKRKVSVVMPGSRVAVNLANLSCEALQRGFIITSPGGLRPTRIIEVRLCALSGLARPIEHNAPITFHTGASEVAGKLRLLDKERLGPGETGWGQVVLNHQVAVAKGDLFILRSDQGTIGGGEIINPYARRRPRFQASVIEALQSKERGSAEDIVLATLHAREPIDLHQITSVSFLSETEAVGALELLVAEKRVVGLTAEGSCPLFFSIGRWKCLEKEAQEIAQDYHRRFPLRRGMPKEDLRSKLQIPSRHFANALDRLTAEGLLVEGGALVRLPSHETKTSGEQQAEIDTFLEVLSQNPYYPTPETLPDPELLNLLIKDRRVVRVSDGIIFTAAAYDEMAGHITGHLKANGKVTVGEVRDMFQTSRRHALALMEHLDRQRVTRRIGDERVLW